MISKHIKLPSPIDRTGFPESAMVRHALDISRQTNKKLPVKYIKVIKIKYKRGYNR
jgi:hypothetical protein